MLKTARTQITVVVVATFCMGVVWWRSGAEAAHASTNEAGVSSSDSRLWVLRLHPGDDLVASIMKFARENSIDAGGIVTCVGSLSRARLRFANQSEYQPLESRGQHFEIISMVGTFSTDDYHLHLGVSNESGEVFGGHASTGNKVYTTAEIVIVEGLDWKFRRLKDPDTTYPELSPVPNERRRGPAKDETPDRPRTP